MGRVRVVLVEDNDVFREALELLLSMRGDVEVVASVADGASAVNAAVEYRPDVVLMDYRLPALDGVQATTQLRAAQPGVAAGAVACLTKDQELEEIVAAIQQAAAVA